MLIRMKGVSKCNFFCFHCYKSINVPLLGYPCVSNGHLEKNCNKYTEILWFIWIINYKGYIALMLSS